MVSNEEVKMQQNHSQLKITVSGQKTKNKNFLSLFFAIIGTNG